MYGQNNQGIVYGTLPVAVPPPKMNGSPVTEARSTLDDLAALCATRHVIV